MVKRILAGRLKYLAAKFPVICVTGPRQSGKTTLAVNTFPAYKYFSLEDPDTREFALKDPREFLSAHKKGLIIDEVQRLPQLFSYIQGIVDENSRAGRFILTGSQNFLLQEKISQSLAGRVSILNLLPFSAEELKNTVYRLNSSDAYIFKGFYPRIYDKKIPPAEWYSGYIQTYLERDIRLLKNISDLNSFQKFIRLCAGRIGQMVNLSALASDCGITHNTAKAWLSVLEASYIIFFLRPYYKNFSKRLIKMPKLYFYDTGLACYLLNIQTYNQLAIHYLRGSLFESFVVSEALKHALNNGIRADFYYLRDKTGHEIDCVIESGGPLLQVEIKSTKTLTDDCFEGLRYWFKLTGAGAKGRFLVYNGEENQSRSYADVINWKDIPRIFTPSSKKPLS
jgi:predicted AAA+ superfamily ATPase